MDSVTASLIALDSYNRGVSPDDIDVPFNAEIIRRSVQGEFAAFAYYLPDSNEVVVAYRGTDNQFGDGLTGWPIGTGQYDWGGTQADLALAFYVDLVAQIADPTSRAHSASLSLTGHSLGGGLAGLVASLNELPAHVFDAIPFADAATKLYEDVSGPYAALYAYWSALAYPDGVIHEPSFSQITSIAIEGEIASDLRWGRPVELAGANFIVTSGLDAEVVQQIEIAGGTVSDAIDLHSQALLAIALYGGTSHSPQREAGGDAIYHHLFDSALATKLGFASTEDLRQNLAYSVDDDVVGLDSLFSDMDELGTIVQSFSQNPHIAALAKLSIVHAAHIIATGDSTLRMGLLEAGSGVVNVMLAGTKGASAMIDDFLEFSSATLDGVFFDIPTTGLTSFSVSSFGYGGTVHIQAGGTLFLGTMYEDDIRGSADNDIILSLGTDPIFHDIIDGGGGDDIIYASAGDDLLSGGEGNDRMHGGAGIDTFYDDVGSDAMFGDAGNDIFHLGVGEEGDTDYVHGGASGTDVVNVSQGATFRLDAGGASTIRDQVLVAGFTAPTGHGVGVETASGNAFLQSVERVNANAAANEIHLTNSSDLTASGGKIFDFTAGANDVAHLVGAGMQITLDGVNAASQAKIAGNTTTALLGIDEWNLSTWTDTVTVNTTHANASVVTFNGGGYDGLRLAAFTSDLEVGVGVLIAGVNVIANGFYLIETGSGDDTFFGTDDRSYFLGGGGTNTFHASLGADTLISTGNLIIDYSASAARVRFNADTSRSARANTDTPTNSLGAGDYLRTTNWSDITGTLYDDYLVIVGKYGTLRGNGGNDHLYGFEYNDVLIGGDGDEVIRPGQGNNEIDFGSGAGTLDYSTRNAGVIDLQARTFVFGAQHDIVAGTFTKLIGTIYNDEIRGSEGDDEIIGGGGVDTIEGMEGNDILTIGAGTLYGGEGDDILKATSSGAMVHGDAGNDTITVGKNSGAYGGSGDDIITGREGSTLHGGSGNDVISTSVGGVTIIGGAGADSITFDTGLYSSSTLSYLDSASGISLSRSNGVTYGVGGDADGDVITGNFKLIGSDHADTIVIQQASTIDAMGGDDVIILAQGDATAKGGAGNDTFTLTSRQQIAYGEEGDDTFYGHGNMYGGDGDDVFILGYGSYRTGMAGFTTTKLGGVVRSGAGENTIVGGEGNDKVWMGEGSNTFDFSMLGGDDVIYEAGSDDKITLSGIEAFTSMADVIEHLVQDGNNAVLDLGYRMDHPDVYDSSDPYQNLGSLTFVGMTTSAVAALDWDFA